MTHSLVLITLVAFAAAFIATLLATPAFKRLGARYRLVDLPDKRRKLHRSPVPLIGGLTVYLITLGTLLAIFSYFGGSVDGDWQVRIRDSHELLGLALAATVLLAVGLIDDRFLIRGRQKLIGQIAAATILIYYGYTFDSIRLWGIDIEFGHFALLIMYAWILGGINSVNLLDGADGFATTLGILLSAALCVMSISLGHWDNAIIAAALCGALVGFLCFNFPPASAYLGDSGSMLIGMMVAALAIRSTSKEPLAYAFFAPLALLAIPMFDTLAAIIRRRLTGKSIYTTDRGHLHHALMRRGLSPRLALLWFSALCMTTVIGATLSLIHRQSEYAILSVVTVVIFLIAGRVFGFAEFKLLSNKAMGAARTFFEFGSPKENRTRYRHLTVQLQGDRNWEVVWQSIREFAEKHQLSEITLDLDLPWIHESFHATYRQNDARNDGQEWNAEVPVQLADQVVGRLLLRADLHQVSVYDTLPQLVDAIDSLQPYLQLAIDRQTFKEAISPAGQSAASSNNAADPSPTREPSPDQSSVIAVEHSVEIEAGGNQEIESSRRVLDAG